MSSKSFDTWLSQTGYNETPKLFKRKTSIKSLPVAILLFLLGQPSFLAAAQTDGNTVKQDYSATLQAYRRVSGGIRDANSDLERKAAVERMGAFSSQFIDLAAKHPQDPVALTALRQAVQIVGSTDSGALQAWEMNSSDFPSGSSDGSSVKIVELVLRDHVRSDKLGPVIDRMRYAYRLEFEKCLSTILEKNPHHEVQGLACLALAQFLHDKLRMLRLVEDRPELEKCYEIVFGADYLPKLQRLGQAKLSTRIENLFERAAGPYAAVRFRTGTVGETATSELFELRHLGIGKLAPDIQGVDQDGRRFQLSDYRGKVVLLYFWSEF